MSHRTGHPKRSGTREQFFPMSTSSRSASNTTPTSKWHRDANMGFQMLCSWYSKLSSDENCGRGGGPFYKGVIVDVYRCGHLSLSHIRLCGHPYCHTSPRSGDKLSLDAEFVSSKSSLTGWYSAALLGRIGQNVLLLQIHGIFVVVHAYMLHRCDLGLWGHTCPSQRTIRPLPRDTSIL